MKKTTLLFICLMLVNMAIFAQDTLVYWDFKVAPYDTLADGGMPVNSNALVGRDTSWHNKFAYSGGALVTPDKCISSTGWAGGNGIKYYQIGFSSGTFHDLVLYSRQRSSGTGPRTFKVQYRITQSGSWTDVPGSSVTTGDNFTTGTLAGISLPAACEDQADLYLRWVMTSDSSVNGGVVGSAGTSRLDEVFIISTTFVGINTTNVQERSSLSPNPCDGTFSLYIGSDTPAEIDILDITGKVIDKRVSEGNRVQIMIPWIGPGIYFVRTTCLRTGDRQTRKLVVR